MTIDFSLAVSVYIFLLLVVILAVWLFNKKQEKQKDLSLDPKFIWHCSVCTYNYINTKEETISVCPRCGSYNKRDV